MTNTTVTFAGDDGTSAVVTIALDRIEDKVTVDLKFDPPPVAGSQPSDAHKWAMMFCKHITEQ